MEQMNKMTDAKKWAIAAMAIILLVAGVIFVVTPSNATPLVMEIQNYRVLYGMGTKLDIGPVAKQHISKKDMKPKDAVKFFEKAGFDVKKVRKYGKTDGKKYDTVITSRFNAVGIVPSMKTEYKFTVYYKGQKLVRTVGAIIKEKKNQPAMAVASAKQEILK